MRRFTAVALVVGACLLGGCFSHASSPLRPIGGPTSGVAPAEIDPARACGDWRGATHDDDARSHVSFPELEPSKSCFVRVAWDADGPRADPTPPGCEYAGDRATLGVLARSIDRLDRIARGERVEPPPMELACDLPDDVRRDVAAHNARVERSLAARLARGAEFPYAAAATFGYGHPIHATPVLARFRPDDACAPLAKRAMDDLSINVDRAFRAASLVARGVAPVMIASGGAVHSATYESFALEHVAVCTLGLRRDRVLVDPCADHTHTNLRNTGALVVEIGGRRAFVVTDDGLQAAYLQEWTSFDVIGGSIDQRSLRDWGYLLGSWRQASVGMDAGFWYTPYRFWADPRRELRDLTCLAR